jgi:hypothetical protein
MLVRIPARARDRPPRHEDRTAPMPEPAVTPPSAPGEPAARSRLAIVALVVALVPCCPMSSLLGAFLGLVALRRIRLSEAGPGPRLGGTRIALAAIVAGAASAVVWSSVLDRFVRGQESQQRDAILARVAEVVDGAQTGDAATARAVWATDDANRPSPEEIEDFGRAATERYGRFERFAIISAARSGSMLAPEVEVAGMFHFERESPLGSVRFVMRFTPGSLVPLFVLQRLTIEDQEHGGLELGAPREPSG